MKDCVSLQQCNSCNLNPSGFYVKGYENTRFSPKCPTVVESCERLWETNYPWCYSWCRAPGCDIWPVQRSSGYCFWWRDPLPHSLGTETYHLWLPLPSTQRACHHRQQRYINYLLNCYNAVLTFVHKHSVSPKTVMTMNSLRIQLATWKCYISFMRIRRKNKLALAHILMLQCYIR